MAKRLRRSVIGAASATHEALELVARPPDQRRVTSSGAFVFLRVDERAEAMQVVHPVAVHRVPLAAAFGRKRGRITGERFPGPVRVRRPDHFARARSFCSGPFVYLLLDEIRGSTHPQRVIRFILGLFAARFRRAADEIDREHPAPHYPGTLAAEWHAFAERLRAFADDLSP